MEGDIPSVYNGPLETVITDLGSTVKIDGKWVGIKLECWTDGSVRWSPELKS